MANTTFVNQSTVIDASWLNDVNDVSYDVLGDGTNVPSSKAVVRANLNVPQRDGTDASGTWGINISGTAAGLTSTLAVANGGTGATSAANARTNLGLVIGTDVLAPTGSGASLTGFKKIAQIVRFESQSLGSSTATITWDDSIPQISEGDQFITQAFTPTNASSTIYVRLEIPVYNRNATAQAIIAALFLNDDTNAKAVASGYPGTANQWDGILTISKSMTAWSGAKTFSVRLGCSAGSLFYTNGRPATLGTLGARQTTSLEIIEVLP